MPTLQENIQSWSHYDWTRRGDEWSSRWGGTEYLWLGTIFPRIRAFLPTESILELGPGFGRCTQYLKDLCSELTVVDLVERCIQGCRERFSSSSHIKYFVNDGKSLNMVPNQSIDFIFSWDSLVHAECEVMQLYVTEFARVLKADGFGFVHHSNMGYYYRQDGGKSFVKKNNIHWRAETMSSKLFEQYCEGVGLQCVSQEIIGWGGKILNDCFSLFTHMSSSLSRPNHVVENEDFMSEVDRLATLARLYDPAGFTRDRPPGSPQSRGE